MPTYRYHEDSRDGKVYKCVLMPDGKWWSAENLAWDGDSAKLPPDGNLANVAIHGWLYPWSSRSSLAPAGAHIPSDAESQALITAVGGTEIAGKKIKSSGWNPAGTDDYGFSALPSGIYSYSPPSYYPPFGEVGYIMAGPLRAISLAYNSDYATLISYAADYAISVRFIVDVFNVPSNFKLFGAPFQGFERGLSCTITRQIQIQESEGGSVTLIPTAPAEFDSWDIEAGFMVNAAQAQAIEANLPPYGTPSEGIMRLPPRNGEASFPGLLPMTYAGAPTDYDSYTLPLTSPVDVQGRVAVRADLFSYRLAFRFYAASATLNNRPTATSTTAPVWLTGKFAQHGISDPSTHVPTIQAGVGPTINFNFHPTKQGRTKRITITLDCLSQARADELVGFFRGVRHNPTTITLDNGASGFEAVSVYLTALSFTRGDGLYWTGSLEVVLA